MPTGYTSGILDGKITTFKDYAINCMRAFGATIHMRDEQMDKQYEPRVPSTYYQEHIDESKKKLAKFHNVTDKKIIALSKKDINASIDYYKKKIVEMKSALERYHNILADAHLFVPPTPDHQEIKKFMIDQIATSIDHDCNFDYYEKELKKLESELENLDAKVIRKELVDQAVNDIAYYEKNHNEEVEHCNESNEWVEVFIESIKDK